jgi:hypothetical protein
MKSISEQEKMQDFAKTLDTAYKKLQAIYTEQNQLAKPNTLKKNTTPATPLNLEQLFMQHPKEALEQFERQLQSIAGHFNTNAPKDLAKYNTDITQVQTTLNTVKNGAEEIKNHIPENAKPPLDKIFDFIQKIFPMLLKIMGKAQEMTEKFKPKI